MQVTYTHIFLAFFNQIVAKYISGERETKFFKDKLKVTTQKENIESSVIETSFKLIYVQQ